MLKFIYIFILFISYAALCCSPIGLKLRNGINNDFQRDSVIESFSWSESEDLFFECDFQNKGNSDYTNKKKERRVIYNQKDRSDQLYDCGFEINDLEDIDTGKSINRIRKSNLRVYRNKYRKNRRQNNDKGFIHSKKNKVFKARKTNERIKSLNKKKDYMVRNGDNLFQIAKRFNVSVNELCKVNKIKNSNRINSGMFLRIPLQRTVKTKTSNRLNSTKIKPRFIWPMKKITRVQRDGSSGVKSIGIIITSMSGAGVISSATGIVKKVGKMRGYGRYIVLKHDKRFITIYANLHRIDVFEGQVIKSGRVIGYLEKNRLHFLIGNSGKPENPLRYLPRRG